MKKKRFISLALSMVLALASITPIFAAKDESEVQKDETVYVLMDDEGKISEETVSVWLHSDKPLDVMDVSDLKDIRNLKGREEPEKKDGKLHWKSKGNDIYYQGKTNKKLPVDLEIEYRLNGKKINPAKIEGKSGKLEITIKATNHEKFEREINGKKRILYTPYVVAGGLNLPTENFKNVDTNGKVMDDGKNQAVAFTLFPGINETIGPELDDLELDIYDYIEKDITITADVKNFEKPTMLVSIADIFQTDPEFEEFDSFDELKDGLEELDDKGQELLDGVIEFSDAIYDLVDAHEDLYDGSNELYDGVNAMQSNVEDAIEGTEKLASGSKDLNDGAKTLNSGLAALVEAVNTMDNKMEDLTDGAKELKEGSDQLAAGIEIIHDEVHAARDKYKETITEEKIAEMNAKKEEAITTAKGVEAGAQSTADNLVKLRELVNSKKFDEEEIENPDLIKETEAQRNIANALKIMANKSRALGTDIRNLENQLARIKNSEGEDHTQENKILATANENLDQARANTDDELAKQSIDNGMDCINMAQQQLNQKNSPGIDNTSEVKAMNENLANMKKSKAAIDAQLRVIKENANLDFEEIGVMVDQISAEHEKTVVALNLMMTQMEEVNKKIAAGMAMLPTVDSKIDEMVNGIDKLYDGSQELKDGQGELYDGTLKLQEGVSDMKDGVQKLYDGSTQLAEGTQTAVEGSEDLDEGINKLQLEGVAPLKDGVGALNGGLAALHNKKGDLTEAADDLTEGTDEYMEDGVRELRSEITEKTDDVEDIIAVRDELIDISQTSDSFTGKPAGVDTKVKFVYKID